jgi:hypothetical protein
MASNPLYLIIWMGTRGAAAPHACHPVHFFGLKLKSLLILGIPYGFTSQLTPSLILTLSQTIITLRKLEEKFSSYLTPKHSLRGTICSSINLIELHPAGELHKAKSCSILQKPWARFENEATAAAPGS